ncbi:aldehyde dehydrogenase family protein [Miniphocaeibacter halophilus]|uniref:Aldehyde dehydrogenase family protein n=1 Tax=Miniphocaeibacter halophilus TaxID=2931922 RepID=A0AC61MY42_9FIRM|nr:aldehyde dehydrogenase family protein [Miniphocaeibacter halophilus]QQK08193.1 aldehyde dehydrogenase family protein [Miniphocaeibacter halophilus]
MDYNKLYINGQFVKANSNEYIEVENPSNRKIIGKVPRGNSEDVNNAVNAAFEAFKTWKNTSIEERIEIIEKFKEYIENNLEKIANIITEEQGSPVNFAQNNQVRNNINRINAYINIAKNFKFEEELGVGRVRYEPVGVVACLTPWNFPMGQIIQKIVPAILSGCTVVLKPSQIAPLTSYYIVEGLHEAGLPKGVLNLVTGKGREVGNVLAEHKLVNKVSFTGSTEGGKEVAKTALNTVKKITLELGGKSPAIFLDNSNIEIGVKRIFTSLFGNCGQTCVAFSRAIVIKDVKDEVIAEIIKQYSKLVVGNPKDINTNVGPLVSEKQFKKVKKYIELGIEEGANIILGEIPREYENGYFIKPVIFDKVNNNMTIAREEIFGPVLSIIEVENIEEAIEIANDTIYGLSAGVYGKDEIAQKVAREINSGEVYINKDSSDAYLPFGGYKQSGLGREAGIFGFKEFLEVKSLIG